MTEVISSGEMASAFNAFPPHKLHISRTVSSAEALTLLSSYLDTAANNASLQPDALLRVNGPESVIQGADTSLVLHNLKRVQAGLQGKHLGADLSLAQFGGQGLPQLQVGGNDTGVASRAESAVDQSSRGQATEMGATGWQDMDEYEREQDIVVDEGGKRVAEVADDTENATASLPISNVVDTRMRKNAKKQRRKEEKQKREQQKGTGTA